MSSEVEPKPIDFIQTDFFQKILEYAGGLDNEDFYQMTTQKTAETVKMEKLRRTASDGCIYRVVLQHKGKTHTLRFKTKTTAKNFKNDIVHALRTANRTAVRGSASKVKEIPAHLNMTLGQIALGYILYCSELSTGFSNNFKAFMIGAEGAGLEGITLYELFEAASAKEKCGKILKAYRKKTGSPKAFSLLGFLKTDLFNNFERYLKEEIKKKGSESEAYRSLFKNGFYSTMLKSEVLEFVKENKSHTSKRKKVHEEDVSIEDFVNSIHQILLKSNNRSEIQFCLYALLNSYLGLRQNELNALRLEDLELDGDPPGLLAKHSIQKLGSGYFYSWNRTKTGKGETYRKNLGEVEVGIIRLLLSPLFSADFNNYFSCALRKDSLCFVRKKKTPLMVHGKSFRLNDKSIGEWFLGGGAKEINNHLEEQKIKIKRVLLVENLTGSLSKSIEETSKAGFFLSAHATSIKMKKLCKKHDLTYVSSHTRYRKGITTFIKNNHGADVALAHMGWKSPEMVGTYTAGSRVDEKSASDLLDFKLDVLGKGEPGVIEATRESAIEKILKGTPLKDLSEEELAFLN